MSTNVPPTQEATCVADIGAGSIVVTSTIELGLVFSIAYIVLYDYFYYLFISLLV